MDPAVTPSSSTAGRERACDAGGPQALEVAVFVISYLAAAAAGGVIGNRADAGLCFFYRSLRRRWRARTGETITDSGQEDAAGARRVLDVTAADAVDVATTAAAHRGYDATRTRPLAVREEPDGTWIVHLQAHDPASGATDRLRVTVPVDDLWSMTVLIHPASLDELP